MSDGANYVVIETELDQPDAFVASQEGAQDIWGKAQTYVRRPLRGLQIKKETYAVLSAQGLGDSPILANSSARGGEGVNFTSNFILQSVQETRQEKHQPLTTFGAPYVFFFGEQPRMMTFSAVLLNSADFQWEVEWWDNYENVFRGTRLTDRGLRAYLSYDDKIIEGYLLQAGTSTNSERPLEAQLTFTMFVTDVILLVTPGEQQISSRHSGFEGSVAFEFDNIESQGTIGDDSATAEVRKRNISAITSQRGTGLLAALRNSLDKVNDFVDKVGNVIDNAVDWLYGRNMVIPAGFAGSDVTAGKATFATGSGLVTLASSGQLGGILASSSLNIRLPGVATGATTPAQPSPFFNNEDEYPNRSAGFSANEAAKRFQEAAWGFDGTGRSTAEKAAVGLAEQTFLRFGYVITNEEGQYMTDAMWAAGKATFAALSYAAMTTGASQAAASLTVGEVVG